MGATNVGSIGLNCLVSVESMRAKSKNLQSGISGRMRRELDRAKDVIKTLIYKAETTGDPTFLRIKHRELTDKVEKFELAEVLRNREIEEMRGIIENLKKSSPR